MNNIVVLANLFLLVIYTSYSMDPAPTEKVTVKRKKKSLIFSYSLSNLRPSEKHDKLSLAISSPVLTPRKTESISRTQTSSPEFLHSHRGPKPLEKSEKLILAVQNNDMHTISKILCDPTKDPNTKDQWGNTALHHALLREHTDITLYLLSQPRIRSLIKNNSQVTPRRLALEQHNQKLYNAIAEHEALEQFINALLKTDRSLLDAEISNKEIIQKTQKAQQNLTENWPHYVNNDFLITMVHYHRQSNRKNILHFLMDFSDIRPNKNRQDEDGNTMLHHAVILRNQPMVALLLHDPEVNGLIQNNDKKNAHQLLSTVNPKDSVLRTFLFAHINLECAVHRQACELLLCEPTTIKFRIDDPSVEKSIKKIEKQLIKIDSAQKYDRKLPQSVERGAYATKQFIFQKLIYYLTNQKQRAIPVVSINTLREQSEES